jgi:signal transduction histidine kinase
VSVASTRPRPVGAEHPAVRHAVDALLLEERTRWAMQIHDGLTQAVTSAVLELQTLRRRIADDPDGAVIALGQVEDAIRADLQRIRELLFEMTTEQPRVEPAFAGFVQDVAERWKISVRVTVVGDLTAAPPDVLETTYAIVAEALANAAKHSGASEATVRVRADNAEVTLAVEDGGRGIALVSDHDPHFGLKIMRARAESLGGSIDIESTPGRGTCVRAVLPVEGRGEHE